MCSLGYEMDTGHFFGLFNWFGQATALADDTFFMSPIELPWCPHDPHPFTS
jgi:hypothetical protein